MELSEMEKEYCISLHLARISRDMNSVRTAEG